MCFVGYLQFRCRAPEQESTEAELMVGLVEGKLRRELRSVEGCLQSFRVAT